MTKLTLYLNKELEQILNELVVEYGKCGIVPSKSTVILKSIRVNHGMKIKKGFIPNPEVKPTIKEKVGEEGYFDE